MDLRIPRFEGPGRTGMAVQLDGFNADYYNNLATVVGSSGANSEVP
jgi:hypothetical protein